MTDGVDSFMLGQFNFHYTSWGSGECWRSEVLCVELTIKEECPMGEEVALAKKILSAARNLNARKMVDAQILLNGLSANEVYLKDAINDPPNLELVPPPMPANMVQRRCGHCGTMSYVSDLVRECPSCSRVLEWAQEEKK